MNFLKSAIEKTLKKKENSITPQETDTKKNIYE
jgi:hypothetical protein